MNGIIEMVDTIKKIIRNAESSHNYRFIKSKTVIIFSLLAGTDI